jgi:Ca2+-binding RTX toxin-like protein
VSLSPASLTFDSTNWNTLQPVAVTATNDAAREGFHHGLIRFSVQSATDTNGSLPAVDVFDHSLVPNHFVGLSRTPLADEPVTVTVGSEVRSADRYQVVANKVIFLDDLGRPEIVIGTVSVSYRYAVPGYDQLEMEPVLAKIGDANAGVLIQESFGSTDVIEGGTASDGTPQTDTYTVVLTSQPAHDVIVRIKPQITKATRGVIRNDLVQVQVASAGVTPDADGILSLVFTPQNWSQPRTVQVIAVDDAVVDGGDTQIFAPIPHMVSGIQGPLFIDGQGGLGSLVAFAPVMLPGETNIRASTGNVVAVEADAITIQMSDALNWLATESSLAGNPGYVANVADLLNRTITITEGPGLEQFRLIVAVAETGPNGEHLRLELNEPWDVPADQIPGITKYALTEESINFFVKEEEQVDVLMLHHDDSMADSSGRMTEDRITGLGMGPDLLIGGSLQPGGVTFENLEVATLQLGSGREQFEVLGTPSRRDNFRTWTMINTGDGDDQVTIALNALDAIVAAGAATSADDNVLANAAANFSTAGRGLAGYQLRITGGAGAGQTRRIRFNTATEITLATPWQTLPNATSTYEVINESDGLLAVDGEIGDDQIDASASTLPIVIFGSDGSDGLKGGAGADIIFGDRGRVEYLDEQGAIVTRLGTAPPVITGMASAAANSTGAATLTDSAAAFPVGDDSLAGLYVRITDGAGALQRRRIVSNTATELVLDAPWDELPDATSSYRISTVPERQTDGVMRNPTRLFTLDHAIGGGDVVHGNSGNDLLLGATGSDIIHAGEGHDLAFGDFAEVAGQIDPALLPLDMPVHPFLFRSIHTLSSDPAGDDAIFGDGDDDILIGGQAADFLSGGAGDDDLIGGHNVPHGHDGADALDGGSGQDSLAGDNASILRKGDSISPRFRRLTGATIFDAAGNPLVAAAPQPNPSGRSERSIVLFNHSDSALPGTFGADVMAGGSGDDDVLGQLGDDILHGDGQVAAVVIDEVAVSVEVATANVAANANPAADGDDLVEGGGGGDLLLGGLGQDDLMGGSSTFFGFTLRSQRPDGADKIFGGNGDAVVRNDLGDLTPTGHARDADILVGDNGEIHRLLGAAGAYLTFNYDTYSPALRIIPRAVLHLDYVPGAGGFDPDLGAADILHGESGDDQVWGQTGNDILFGEGQDDDLIGGDGADRVYGGAGEDGIAGDNGLIVTSRNGLAEPLLGVTAAHAEETLSVPGPFVGAVEYIAGRLTKAFTTIAWLDGSADVLYGGLGDDFMHAGAGDDALSGAEALAEFYNEAPQVNLNPLGYDPATRKLAAYDANNPRQKIAGFLVNFDAATAAGQKIEDGKDRMFGDLGHDWLVGGTGKDRLFGGPGDDLLNADDNHDTSGGLNNAPDSPAFADGDFAYGGGGLDVLIANTGNDRLVDWKGEFNSFIVPFSPFGMPTVVRSPSPHWQSFVMHLGRTSGADMSLTNPNSEIGLTTSDTGGPRDPQAGNLPGVGRDTQGGPENDRGLTASPAGSTPGAPSASAAAGASAAGGAIPSSDQVTGAQSSLYVFGTVGNDVIVFRKGPSSGSVEVLLNGVSQGVFSGITNIYAYGEAGNDRIAIENSAGALESYLYGGPGNDILEGGIGANFLEGGDGDDRLKGNTGRDVLFGGGGADSLYGDKNDDVLVGGVYRFADDLFAAAGLLAEWKRTDLAYATRVQRLTLGHGLAAGFALSLENLIDDLVKDQLFGQQNDDLFVLGGNDTADERNTETALEV